ncbi:glycosyltransferase involved in cell wall biosynthesis [Rhizobium sp. PP-F2F-G48]|uniref:glycosyltransferase family 4 protein n=1 Tax=Rhizobium sp. PP-F2F-G48 TaxID=2135651 RepID=UPI00104F7F8A|nr:glycosyltransferase family 4 protein [Rhizobium sp. PP-F2F-G48]TCM58253.1 glycosyltransferase involved in cell wall biosynthesis [Rhizobium sp. PP-F2F-G48]
MKIAFYAPLKSPRHPTPSGDRLMSRLMMEALACAGHQVSLVSELRSFLRSPQDIDDLRVAADAERERIEADWRTEGVPDCWFCYHPYYKAPDLLGPPLAHGHGIGYVTAEASYSARRDGQGWAAAQAALLDTLTAASVNISMTERDRIGILEGAPAARVERLQPFIDPTLFLANEPAPHPGRLVTVAMMRPGDKMDSYRMLAAALSRLLHLPFTLTIVGDGKARGEVEALFAPLGPGRVVWAGERSAEEVAALLSTSSLYVWPGCGEAYGLAYLEAQAAGLPVVAQAIAGVPEVVQHGRTGALTPAGDVEAYAGAIAAFLADETRRQAMGAEARLFAGRERALAPAAVRLADILDGHVPAKSGAPL